MNPLLRFTVILFVMLACTGCNMIWDVSNRSGLKNDVTQLLATAGVSMPVSCRMLGDTRSGVCEGVLTSAEVQRITNKLKLTAVKPTDSSNFTLKTWLQEGNTNVGQTLKTWHLFQSKRRATELRLGNGSSFEYCLLFYNPQNDSARIQVSYAYG